MNDRRDDDLDRDIEALLDAVVATTPEPPDLETRTMTPEHDDDTGRANRWIIGGGIGLVAAAAVIGLVVLNTDDTDSIRLDPADTTSATAPAATDPATTEPSATEFATTTVTPATTTTAPTSAAAIPAGTEPGDATAGTTAEPPPVTEPSTTPAPTPAPTTTTTAPPPTAASPDEQSAALTTAGDFGVSVGVPEGSESLITIEPMAFATTAEDGRIFAQRSQDVAAPDADTTVYVIDANSSSDLTPIDLPRSAAGTPDDGIILHDVATFDGAVTLLYETAPASGVCANPQQCVGTIMAWQPDTGTTFEIADKIVFEGGWSGLELARNGLIVGTESESAAQSIFIDAIGELTPPTAAVLGLEDFYFDCNVCPFAYSADPSGRYIGWVDSGAGVTQENVAPNAFPPNEIAVVDVTAEAGGTQRRVVAELSAASGVLDIADVVFGDEGFAEGQATFQNGGTDADGNPLAPVEIDLTSGEIGRIDARSATLNELLLPR